MGVRNPPSLSDYFTIFSFSLCAVFFVRRGARYIHVFVFNTVILSKPYATRKKDFVPQPDSPFVQHCVSQHQISEPVARWQWRHHHIVLWGERHHGTGSSYSSNSSSCGNLPKAALPKVLSSYRVGLPLFCQISLAVYQITCTVLGHSSKCC